MKDIKFKKVFIILLSGCLIAIAYNYFSDKGVSLFYYDNKKILSAELLGDNAEEQKHISLKEAHQLYEAGVIFIDARDREDYLAGHIKNSISIPWDDFEKYQNRLENIPKDEPVVSYCGGADCDLSIMLGNKLAKMGYGKVFVFFGGWNSWADAKYPVEKSNK